MSTTDYQTKTEKEVHQYLLSYLGNAVYELIFDNNKRIDFSHFQDKTLKCCWEVTACDLQMNLYDQWYKKRIHNRIREKIKQLRSATIYTPIPCMIVLCVPQEVCFTMHTITALFLGTSDINIIPSKPNEPIHKKASKEWLKQHRYTINVISAIAIVPTKDSETIERMHIIHNPYARIPWPNDVYHSNDCIYHIKNKQLIKQSSDISNDEILTVM